MTAVRSVAADVAAEVPAAVDRACAWAPLYALLLLALYMQGVTS